MCYLISEIAININERWQTGPQMALCDINLCVLRTRGLQSVYKYTLAISD